MTAPLRAADPDGVALLAARAAELARPLDEQDADSLDLLLLAVGDRQVAVPLKHVRAVQLPGPVAQVPGSSGALAGMAAGHGAVLPVAGLAALLGLPDQRPADEQWVVVLHDPDAPVGLLVDRALDVVTVATDQLSSSPDESGLVQALLHDGALILDIPALLRDPRLWLSPRDPTEELP